MYHHLTQNNRIELSLLRRLSHLQRSVATVLGVDPATVRAGNWLAIASCLDSTTRALPAWLLEIVEQRLMR